MWVTAKPGTKCPTRKKGLYIEAVPVEFETLAQNPEDRSFYNRLLRDGSLVRVEAKPVSGEEEKAND